MPDKIDIANYLISEADTLQAGDDVRVRPWEVSAPAYNQGGPNTGPRFNGVKFLWGQALKVVEGDSDPAAGLVSLELVTYSPETFMSEKQYQNYLTAISNNE